MWREASLMISRKRSKAARRDAVSLNVLETFILQQNLDLADGLRDVLQPEDRPIFHQKTSITSFPTVDLNF